MPTRDEEVIEAVRAALEATRRFDRVIDGTPWTDVAGDRERAVAWVELESWATEGRTVEHADRVVRYRLWVSARAADREGRREARRRVVRLCEAAEGALNSTTLGGLEGVQPARTFLESGRHDLDSAGPTAAVELAGRVTVGRSGREAFDASDRT